MRQKFILALFFYFILLESLISQSSTNSIQDSPENQVSPTKVESPQKNSVQSLTEANQEPGLVKIGEYAVFTFRSRMGGFTPKERAKLVSERLLSLANESGVDFSEIGVIETDQGVELILGDRVLFVITEKEVEGIFISKLSYAESLKKKIITAADLYRKEYSEKSLIEAALYSLALTILFVLIYKLTQRVFLKIDSFLQRKDHHWIPTIRLQNLEVVSNETIIRWIQKAVFVSRVSFKLLFVYSYFTFIFSLFPWTRKLGKILLEYILSPLKSTWNALLDYIPNMFFIIIASLITIYVLKLISFVFDQLTKGTIHIPNFFPEWASPTYKIVRFLVLALFMIIIFPYLPGANSPAFQGISLFLGVIFSLGSTSAISNIIAGIVITYMRPFQLGDRVRIADTEGDILEKNLLVTRIRTPKNVIITIPNSTILNSHIINYSSLSTILIHTTVTIGYDVPWKKVEALLIESAIKTKSIMNDPPPFVLQKGLEDYYVSYELNAHCSEPNQMAGVYSELHKNIQDCFQEGNVEIMSPHYFALRDGSETTIPKFKPAS